jgi:hypothetical protein
MAEASGAVELQDEEALQFIERSEAAKTVGKARSNLHTWQAVSLIQNLVKISRFTTLVRE